MRFNLAAVTFKLGDEPNQPDPKHVEAQRISNRILGFTLTGVKNILGHTKMLCLLLGINMPMVSYILLH